MNDNKTEISKIIKYAAPTAIPLIIGVISSAVFFVIAYLSVGMMYRVVWSLGGIFLLGYYIGHEWILPYIYMRKKISDIEKTPDINILINDFLHADRAFNGNIVMGNKYIIAKGFGSIYSYDEISRIYQVVETQAGTVLRRNLYFYDNNNKKRIFCRFDRGKYNDEEMNSVYNYILSKNGNIKFGEL